MFEENIPFDEYLVEEVLPMIPIVKQRNFQRSGVNIAAIDDLSSDEQGCYSSSDGDFKPNTLGLSILIYSYFFSIAMFIYRTIRNIYHQGTILN